MSIFASGRIAWILAIVLGIILFVIGVASTPKSTFFMVAGAAAFLFGVIFLIISFVTKGKAD